MVLGKTIINDMTDMKYNPKATEHLKYLLWTYSNSDFGGYDDKYHNWEHGEGYFEIHLTQTLSKKELENGYKKRGVTYKIERSIYDTKVTKEDKKFYKYGFFCCATIECEGHSFDGHLIEEGTYQRKLRNNSKVGHKYMIRHRTFTITSIENGIESGTYIKYKFIKEEANPDTGAR